MPHPPIIVPEVGYGREKAAAATLQGTAAICAKIEEINRRAAPEVLLLLSPHESYTPGMLFINTAVDIRGSLARFGAPGVQSSITTSQEGLKYFVAELGKAGIPFGARAQKDITADHAALVPLYFLASTFPQGHLPPMIVANPCGLPMDKAVALGKMLGNFADGKRWALLASGDLSHRLTPNAPSGYHPDGQVFDDAVVEALKAGDPGMLTGLSPDVRSNAGECGLRPALVLLGLTQAPLEVFSYEGPFGVGYCNALWCGDTVVSAHEIKENAEDKNNKAASSQESSSEASAQENSPERSLHNSAAPPAEEAKTAIQSNHVLKKQFQPKVNGIRLIPRANGEKPGLAVQAAMLAIKHVAHSSPGAQKGIEPEHDHPFAHLARKTIEARLTGGEAPTWNDIDAFSADRSIWKTQKGCFVSIKNKDGSLRGCIGTFGPTQPDIAGEIMQNAISAAMRDPRFPPMKAEELDNVDISVDVLNTPELLQDDMELDPKHWGVIVAHGLRRGLLLPDLPTVTTVEQQLGIAAKKGGISDLEQAEIHRFSISRHLESGPEDKK